MRFEYSTPRLINMEAYGRLGNRLFLGAHLIAFGCRYGVATLNPAFGEYAKMFPWLNGNAALAYPWVETGSPREARKMAHFLRLRELLPWSKRLSYWGEADFDFDNGDASGLIDQLHTGRSVFLRSWLFRGQESFRRYRSEILTVFRPESGIIDKANDFVKSAKVGYDRAVGVHVRWEDYRGTVHFISQGQFLSEMERDRREHPGKKTVYLLFSNEDLSSSTWPGLDVVISPAPSAMFDLQAMAACDEIMGPPSTFSEWASVVGEIPIQVLRSAGE